MAAPGTTELVFSITFPLMIMSLFNLLLVMADPSQFLITFPVIVWLEVAIEPGVSGPARWIPAPSAPPGCAFTFAIMLPMIVAPLETGPKQHDTSANCLEHRTSDD